VHSRIADLVEPLLKAQHGVVTLAQLREKKVDRRLPRRQGWTELAPQTWCRCDDGGPSDAQLIEAARLYTGGAAVASGVLACRAHRLRDVPDCDGVDVLLPHGTRLRGSGQVRVHQTTRLPAAVTRSDLRVAPSARAVADAARWRADLRDVRALVLAALADGYVSEEHVRREHDDGHRHGRLTLTTALVDWHRGARSAPEAEAADALLALRRPLPPFLLNPRLAVDGRFLGMPDGWFPGWGVGWEVDSLRHHGGSRELASTLARHEDFAAAGLALLHVVPAVLRQDPGAWARDVAARLRERGRGGEPVGLTCLPQPRSDLLRAGG
jgi:hypothetical protein